MPLRVDESFLQFNYEADEQIYDEQCYFNEEGHQKFNEKSAIQMLIMMNRLSREFGLDSYALKRLEITLHEDLPFYATNRRLVFNWASETFLY